MRRSRSPLGRLGPVLLSVLAIGTLLMATGRPALVPFPVSAQDANPRVIGGYPVKQGVFPFMAQVADLTDSTICGGSLVAPGYILTAAHCVHDQNDTLVPPASVLVHIGAANLNDELNMRTIRVQRIIPHPSYDADQDRNDVALLKLPAPGITDIKPILLPVRNSALGLSPDQVLTVAGWGLTTPDGETSDQLRALQLRVTRDSVCRHIWSLNDHDLAVIFCAGGEAGTDSCDGDSGGPLFYGSPSNDEGVYTQIGVVSFGADPCAEEGVPGAYARLAAPAINDFIRKHVPADPGPLPDVAITVPDSFRQISPGALLKAEALDPDTLISQVRFWWCAGGDDCPLESATGTVVRQSEPWQTRLPVLPAGTVTLVARVWNTSGGDTTVRRQVSMLARPNPAVSAVRRAGKSGKKIEIEVDAGGREYGVRSVVIEERKNGQWQQVASSQRDPWIFSIRGTSGKHTYRALATDGAGETGTSRPVRVERKRR
jgi:hypothetical protein